MHYEELQDKELEAKLLSRQNKAFCPEPLVKFKPNGCYLPRQYEKYYEQIRNMEVRPDDIWVISQQKSGNTWTNEMVWLLGNDLDYEGAKQLLTRRIPWLE